MNTIDKINRYISDHLTQLVIGAVPLEMLGMIYLAIMKKFELVSETAITIQGGVLMILPVSILSFIAIGIGGVLRDNYIKAKI